MIILAFEGLDKSGKRTQATLLEKNLTDQGYRVVRSEFHRYDTPTGQLIRKFLDGKYDAPQLAIEALMAADKYAQLDWFRELEKDTDVLILDRYTLSQRAYGEANGIDGGFLYNLLEELPEPDYTVYLDITPELSMARKGQHGENDRYEQDLELLTRARLRYLDSIFMEEADGKACLLYAGTERETLEKQVEAHFAEFLAASGYAL